MKTPKARIPIDLRAPKRKAALEKAGRALHPPCLPPKGWNAKSLVVGSYARQYIAEFEKRVGLPITGTFTTAVLERIGLVHKPTIGEMAVDTMVAWAKAGRYTESPPYSNRVPALAAEAKRVGLGTYWQNMGWAWCVFAGELAALAHGSTSAKAGFAGKWNVLWTVGLLETAKKGLYGMRVVPQSQVCKGTIALLDFPGGAVVDHYERCRGKIRLGLVLTVGGNTAPEGGSGSQSDGGGVYLRIRRASTFGAFVQDS